MKHTTLLLLALALPSSALAQGGAGPAPAPEGQGSGGARPAEDPTPAQRTPPTPEQARAAAAALEKALGEADFETRLVGLRQALAVPCAEVAKALDKAAAKGSPETRRAVVAALGRLEDPLARTLLERRVKASAFAKEDTPFAVEVLRALGRRGAESSVDPLANGPLNRDQVELGRARILALSNIHHPKAVEALLDLSVKAGPWQLQPFAQDLRLGLRRLTGQDFGMDALAWQRWWRDGGKTRGIPAAPAELERLDAARWRLFWEADPLAEREQRGAEGQREGSDEGRPPAEGGAGGEGTPPGPGRRPRPGAPPQKG